MRERSIGQPGRLSCRSARLALATLLAAAGLGTLPFQALAADVPTTGALYRDGPSGRYLLGGEWQRRADPGDQGMKAHWERSRSATAWVATTIPNAANAGDYSEQSYLGGVDWYRKEFRAPDAPHGSRWIVRFESVNYRASVWLNGKLLGRHTGAFLPFELDAAGLKRNGVNRLVVRVDSRRGTLDVPSLGIRRDGRFLGGWWNYTGILRETYLRRVKRFDFKDVLVRPHLACRQCDATINVAATVANLGKQDAIASVEGAAARRDLHFRPASVPGGRARRFTAHLRLENPRLWSPDQPSLYKVRLLVRREDGEVVQRYSVRIGIRHYSVSSDGKLLINYRPVTLRGASMHEDDAVAGSAISPDTLRENVALLRDLGATMTRSHYPLHPLTLELADRYGIVVWSEIPVYQMQDMLFRNKRVRAQSLRMLRDLILRDRNHASVLVWSVGNENTSRPGPGFVRYVRQAKHLARRLDPTRLIGLAFPGYPTIGRQALYAELDALGVNDYFGWYPGPENSIARREDLGPYLDRLHSDYPKQALFITEFGAEANRSGPAEEKGTFEFQRDFLAYHLQVFAERPYINAALVWILRDFHVKPFYDGGSPTPDPPNNRKGLVDYSGVKKPAYDVVREFFGGPRGEGDEPGTEDQAIRNSGRG
jgi:beta-glucuronidase